MSTRDSLENDFYIFLQKNVKSKDIFYYMYKLTILDDRMFSWKIQCILIYY